MTTMEVILIIAGCILGFLVSTYMTWFIYTHVGHAKQHNPDDPIIKDPSDALAHRIIDASKKKDKSDEA